MNLVCKSQMVAVLALLTSAMMWSPLSVAQESIANTTASTAATTASDAIDGSMRTQIKSQFRKPSLIRIMPMIGISSYTIETQSRYIGEVTNHAAGTLGLRVDIGRASHFSFETGVQAFESGASINVPPTESAKASSTRRQINYLGLPLLLKAKSTRSSHRHFFAKLGVMPTILVGAKNEIAEDGSTVDTGTHNVRTTDIQAVGSVGGAIALTRKSSLVIEASFMRGLLSVNQFDNDQYQLFNEGMSLIVGFSFDL